MPPDQNEMFGGGNPEEQAKLIDEMSQDKPGIPTDQTDNDTATIQTPDALKDAQPGDKVTLNIEVVDNTNGELTFKVVA
jgi:hypothetical protein